jgi:hypothetical protein
MAEPFTRFPYLAVGLGESPIVDVPEIVANTAGLEDLPGGAVIAPGNTREVRVGELLARLSGAIVGLGEVGHYVPRKSTELAVAAADGVTTITVDDAHPFVVGDVIVIDDDSNASDAETISAINYETNVITISALSGGTNPLPVNSRVYVTTNGLGTAVGIAAVRHTPNAEATAGFPAAQQNLYGRVKMFIKGTFYKNKLHGSADGVDTQGDTDLGGKDVVSSYGTLYTI